jgi:Lar family restriction alleviation protein
MARAKLLPCPFCGEKRIKLEPFDGDVFAVCKVCNAAAVAGTQASAARAWNRRTPKDVCKSDPISRGRAAR